jgi:hypothetical protein
MEWGLQSTLAGVSFGYSELNLDCGLPKKKYIGRDRRVCDGGYSPDDFGRG